MISRTVTAGALAAVTFSAVATGSYLAVRDNSAAATVQPVSPSPAADAIEEPVKTETEAVVVPAVVEDPAAATVAEQPPEPARKVAEPVRPTPRTPRASPPPVSSGPIAPPAITPPPVSTPEQLPAVAVERIPAETVPVVEPEEPRPSEPAYEELIVPASAVIGLEIERTVSSENAQVEDRVNARVTRDVYANGQVAIPSDSRIIGTVTLVEPGGKMKDRARLGVRFHTLVLADGRQIPLRTETVYREGDSPGAESSRKIGGAAIGGAVLGAILGGGKGAMAGAAAGAAGGTAAVMAGGRNAATLASGAVVTVRLSAPTTIEVAR